MDVGCVVAPVWMQVSSMAAGSGDARVGPPWMQVSSVDVDCVV